MSFRTILSIALASALIAGATTAYAAARGEVYKAPPVVNGDRVSRRRVVRGDKVRLGEAVEFEVLG